MSHAKNARAVRDALEAETGQRPAYPRSRVALQELTEQLNRIRNVDQPLPEMQTPEAIQKILDDPIPKAEQEKTDELTFRQTPWVIGKYLRGWQMDVPEGHPLSADQRAFLEDVRPQIRHKLVE